MKCQLFSLSLLLLDGAVRQRNSVVCVVGVGMRSLFKKHSLHQPPGRALVAPLTWPQALTDTWKHFSLILRPLTDVTTSTNDYFQYWFISIIWGFIIIYWRKFLKRWSIRRCLNEKKQRNLHIWEARKSQFVISFLCSTTVNINESVGSTLVTQLLTNNKTSWAASRERKQMKKLLFDLTSMVGE